jgi:hypothetical protein
MMWQKAFHVVLITFLVVFSAAVLVFLTSALSALWAELSAFIFPGASSGVFGYVSTPVSKLVVFFIVLSGVLVISLLANRRRLR